MATSRSSSGSIAHRIEHRAHAATANAIDNSVTSEMRGEVSSHGGQSVVR